MFALSQGLDRDPLLTVVNLVAWHYVQLKIKLRICYLMAYQKSLTRLRDVNSVSAMTLIIASWSERVQKFKYFVFKWKRKNDLFLPRRGHVGSSLKFCITLCNATSPASAALWLLYCLCVSGLGWLHERQQVVSW